MRNKYLVSYLVAVQPISAYYWSNSFIKSTLCKANLKLTDDLAWTLKRLWNVKIINNKIIGINFLVSVRETLSLADAPLASYLLNTLAINAQSTQHKKLFNNKRPLDNFTTKLTSTHCCMLWLICSLQLTTLQCFDLQQYLPLWGTYKHHVNSFWY